MKSIVTFRVLITLSTCFVIDADGHEIKHLFACDMIVITAMSLKKPKKIFQ